MTDERSGRRPKGAGPPNDEGGDRPSASDSPRKVARTVVEGLLSALTARMLFLPALVWLIVGAGLLMGAWTLVEEERERRENLAALTGRAPGVVEAPWWRLDFDPELLGGAANWPVATTASACARLRFVPDGGRETTTAYCRRYPRGVVHDSLFTWEEALGPVPVRRVGADGLPRIEIRLAPSLVNRLDERAAEERSSPRDTESVRAPERVRRGGRFLREVWRDVDDPFLRLLEEWSRGSAAVTLAYAPDDPARAVPRAVLEEEFRVSGEARPLPGWALAVPLGLFGLAGWSVGCYLLTGGRRWATAVLAAGALALLPWASGSAGRVLGHLWGGAELALAFIQSEMLVLPPELVLDASAGEDGADGEALVWTLESSEYAELLRWIELTPPADPTDADGVLRHLAEEVRRQATALPDEDVAELLGWAASLQERGEGEEIGLLFVDAALALEDDRARSETVRRRAERLLRAVARHPPSDNPYRLAVDERRRILERVPG